MSFVWSVQTVICVYIWINYVRFCNVWNQHCFKKKFLGNPKIQQNFLQFAIMSASVFCVFWFSAGSQHCEKQLFNIVFHYFLLFFCCWAQQKHYIIALYCTMQNALWLRLDFLCHAMKVDRVSCVCASFPISTSHPSHCRRRSWMARTATSAKAAKASRAPPAGSNSTAFLRLSICSSCASSLTGQQILCVTKCSLAFEAFLTFKSWTVQSSVCLLQTNGSQEKAEHIHQFPRAAGHGTFSRR